MQLLKSSSETKIQEKKLCRSNIYSNKLEKIFKKVYRKISLEQKSENRVAMYRF